MIATPDDEMSMADDIKNLLSRFGASPDSYLEVDDFPEYAEALPAVPELATVAVASQPSAEDALPPVASVIERVVSRTAIPIAQPHVAAPTIAPVSVAPSAGTASLRSLLNELELERRNAARVRNEQAAGTPLAMATPAKVVAVVSMKGGVGKSTVSAALAGTLNAGGRTIAIDLDPQNVLQYHLGVSPEVAEIKHAGLSADDWNAGLLDGLADTQVLPFGAPGRDGRRALERKLDEDGNWLARELARMNLDATDVVILDTPPGRTPYLEQALAVADHVVVVITPDAASFMVLEQTDRLFERIAGNVAAVGCSYVVNQFDASRTFSKDMLEVLRRRLGERLIGVVPLDYAISEGLAFGVYPLIDNGCNLPAREEVRAIAEALRVRLETPVTVDRTS